MNIKKRVLYLVNIPSPYRVNFFNELGKLCDLTVLFERRTSDERDPSWQKDNIKNFKPVFLNGIKVKKNTALCFSVSRFLKKELFDVIVIGGYSTPTGMLAIEILKHRKIPFVINTDGGMIKNDHGLKFKIKKRYISSASYWLSTGNHTSKYLENYGASLCDTFIYPFTSLFQKDILEKQIDNDIKNKLKLKHNIKYEKAILSVGRFIYQKGFDVLLQACANIPENCGVYIVGGDPKEDYLEIIKRLNLTNIHFIEFKSKEELKEYYLACDMFVLPTRGDVWGLVVNEAMANGLPVITTDKCVAGLELIKNNENGFIVPVNDSEALAKRINEILKDGMIAEKMSENNMRKVQKYTIENMVINHLNIFEIILNNRNINIK